MSNLCKLHDRLLNDGAITPNEVERIKDHVASDGQLDMEDIKFLISLQTEAKEICPEFDEIFFMALREQLLRDGKISMDEQFQLLKMLYSDGEVRDCEKKFLMELYRDCDEVTPEFTELCETALNCPATDWDVK